MNGKVRIKHPQTGRWQTATILRSRGKDLTVQLEDNDDIIHVSSRNVRPAHSKQRVSG